MSTAGQTRGACPGPWTPMASGDGAIIRVRSAARALTADQVRVLARLARSHGNGVVEITRRANLQLRGLADAGVAAVQAELVGAGLADPTGEREARPALEVDPLAGLDPRCAPIDALAEACEAVLATDPAAAGLAPKLAVVLDGGSGAMGDARADLRVDAGPTCVVSVDGPSGCERLICCDGADVAGILRIVLGALAQRAGERPRVRDLVAARGMAGLRAAVAHLARPDVAPRAAAARSLVGAQAGWLGVGVPFGSAPAAAWETLADIADRFGTGMLRTAPARVVLLPDVPASAMSQAEAAGLCTRADDARLRLVACVGAPGCGSAHGPTRSLATLLGERMDTGATVHVSGCAKGCASADAADVTVVLAPGGAQVGFGLDVARTSLTPAIAVAAVAAMLDRDARKAAP